MTRAPRPSLTPRGEEATFFEHLRSGEIVYTRCSGCDSAAFPLRHVCPTCGSEQVTVEKASGRGKIYSFTSQHRASHPFFSDDVPYTLLLVDLEEGVRLLANLVPSNETVIEVGMSVTAVFDDAEPALTVLRFQLTEPGKGNS